MDDVTAAMRCENSQLAQQNQVQGVLLHSISSLRLEWQSMAWWVWYGITNIIVEGALGAANQLYLETHGHRRDDGEAPDLCSSQAAQAARRWELAIGNWHWELKEGLLCDLEVPRIDQRSFP